MKNNSARSIRVAVAAAMVGALVTLVSCQSVSFAPERRAPDETLLIIPLELVNKVGGAYPIVFSLNFDGRSDSKTGDLLDFAQGFAFVRGVEAGKHRITALLVRWKPTGQIIQQLELDIPFEVTMGGYTLLPVRFSIVRSQGKTTFQTYGLLKDQVTAAQQELVTYRNIESWSGAQVPTGAGQPAAPAAASTEAQPTPAAEAAAQAEPAPTAAAEPATSDGTAATAAPAQSPALQDALSAARKDAAAGEVPQLQRQVDAREYAVWLTEKGVKDFEATAKAEEKAALMQEFLKQSRTRGSSIGLAPSYGFASGLIFQQPFVAPGVYTVSAGTVYGGTVDWTYQVNNWISLGVSLYGAYGPESSQQFDSADNLIGESLYPSYQLSLIPLVVIGNKVDSIALLLGTGIGYSYGETAIPIRAGLYFHGFYAGYLGHYLLDLGGMTHAFEAGYSIFLGSRRTWTPPKGN